MPRTTKRLSLSRARRTASAWPGRHAENLDGRPRASGAGSRALVVILKVLGVQADAALQFLVERPPLPVKFLLTAGTENRVLHRAYRRVEIVQCLAYRPVVAPGLHFVYSLVEASHHL